MLARIFSSNSILFSNAYRSISSFSFWITDFIKASTYFLFSYYSSFFSLIILYLMAAYFSSKLNYYFYFSFRNSIYLASSVCFCLLMASISYLIYSPSSTFFFSINYFLRSSSICSFNSFFFSYYINLYFYFLSLSIASSFYFLSLCSFSSSSLYFFSFSKDYLLILSSSLIYFSLFSFI